MLLNAKNAQFFKKVNLWSFNVFAALDIFIVLELLDKLQKYVCRTVGPSLVASLEPLVHCRNVSNLTPQCIMSGNGQTHLLQDF